MHAPNPIRRLERKLPELRLDKSAGHQPGFRRIACRYSNTGQAIVATRGFMESYFDLGRAAEDIISEQRVKSLTLRTTELCKALNEPIIVLLRDRGAAIFEPREQPRRSIPLEEPVFNGETDPVRCSAFADHVQDLIGSGLSIYDAVTGVLKGEFRKCRRHSSN